MPSLSSVSLVVTIRWCVLMSVFGPLLDALLDFLSKDCGRALLKFPPTGLSCSYAKNLPKQQWIQNSFSLKHWGRNLCSSLAQDMYTIFPVLFLPSRITVGTCGSAGSAGWIRVSRGWLWLLFCGHTAFVPCGLTPLSLVERESVALDVSVIVISCC